MIHPLVVLLILSVVLTTTTPAAAAAAAAVATMTAFALVPSQVPGASSSRGRRIATTRPTGGKKDGSVVASSSGDDADSEAGDLVVYGGAALVSSPRAVGGGGGGGGGSSAAAASSSSSSSSSKKKTKTNRNKKRMTMPKTGNLPDVHWRAISMSHLRCHPNFIPLPPPSDIRALPTREHVRLFRQDSWQWDYLHAGRCTTSQASSALGFLEPESARFLGIPRSLQRGGSSAWDRLRQIPEGDQSLGGLEAALCERPGGDVGDGGDGGGGGPPRSRRPGPREPERLWIPASGLRRAASDDATSTASGKPFPFAAKYVPGLSRDDLRLRRLRASSGGGGDRHGGGAPPSPIRTRMQWGNAQEATSILTALNHFVGADGRTIVREVGMCGAAFDDDGSDDPLLRGVRIGASPDAIVCHGNGTVEVLEVKNHCPFVWNRVSPTTGGRRNGGHRAGKKRGKQQRRSVRGENDDEPRGDGEGDDDDRPPKHFLVRDFELERRIPSVYLPQLMMEMLCVGNSVDLDDQPPAGSPPSSPACASAVMVRQTATRGAILLRLRRDEGWINEMKYWLGQFQIRYVKTGKIPDDNFFWNDDPSSRYRKFLSRTKELSEKVEFVAYIDHGRIQRMLMERGAGGGGGGEIPLFLDRIDDGEEG